MAESFPVLRNITYISLPARRAWTRIGCLLVAVVVACGANGWADERVTDRVDWPCVGGDPGCMRHSPLDQINRANVAKLEVAWTYRTGEKKVPIECTPVVVDGVMYLTTAESRVVALAGATGEELWSFDPFATRNRTGPLASGGVNRGVAYWSDGQPDGERRILLGTADGNLYSIDARTGKLDPSFGEQGAKDLREDLQRNIAKLNYGPTSPPAVYRDVVIVGVSCDEGPGPAAPGDVRGFDVRTGKQRWRFHTVPRPGELGHDTWEGDSWRDRGGANAWGGFSVDQQRGIVYCGTGSATFDFYGGDRKGKNLFANCTLALDAMTGQRRWHFQTLHHDLWDHDIPTYPNLVRVSHDGKAIDAVAQVTKTGYVYLFERDSGKPLFDIVERPVTSSDVPGEAAWPTQPIPVKPPPFSRQGMTEDDLSNLSPASHKFVLNRFRKLRGGPSFNPPSVQGTIVVPGFHGGATWSGASFDPATGILYVNSNNVPNVVTLRETSESSPARYGHLGYHRFLDQDGYPAIKPPWGVLNAIDLNTGQFAWRATLGEFAELTKQGIPQTGTENFGGTIVTAGGLVFIGGTMDERFHAFDKSTGELLWQAKLPAGGYATPCTYMIDGRQFVVIAAGGGGKLGTKPGDAFVAFALPAAE